MTTRPATPLPWHQTADPDGEMLQDSIGHVIADCGAHTLDGVDWAHCEKDAAYIVHAANSYPRLVEALKELLKDCDADLKPMGLHPARVLLRSLGESE